MIAPGAWELEIVTDSESAINKLESRTCKTKGSEWQVVKLIEQLREKRRGEVTFTHQRSHKALDTENSVGNAAADLVADRYTWQTEQWRQTKEVTKLHNGDMVIIYDQKEEKWLTRNLRKEMRNGRETKAEETWNADSSQGKIRGEFQELRKYIHARKTRLGGRQMSTITKLLTTVHTQVPRLRIGVEGMGNCEYCRMAKGREEKRTPEHEAGCRVDKEVDEEQIKEVKDQARRTARPKYREKRREEDENAGEIDRKSVV